MTPDEKCDELKLVLPAPIKLPPNVELPFYEKTAPSWRKNPDLIRKNYLFDADKGIAGGVCLWKEKARAEKWHGADFRKKVKEVYGVEPESQFFETPIVVDNVAGEIAKD